MRFLFDFCGLTELVVVVNRLGFIKWILVLRENKIFWFSRLLIEPTSKCLSTFREATTVCMLKFFSMIKHGMNNLVHKPHLVRQCKHRRREKKKLCMLINSAIVSIVTSLRSNPPLSFCFFIYFIKTKTKIKSVQMHSTYLDMLNKLLKTLQKYSQSRFIFVFLLHPLFYHFSLNVIENRTPCLGLFSNINDSTVVIHK